MKIKKMFDFGKVNFRSNELFGLMSFSVKWLKMIFRQKWFDQKFFPPEMQVKNPITGDFFLKKKIKIKPTLIWNKISEFMLNSTIDL
jgi:hypothetical protein